jgi:hypothetical protein
MPKPLIQGEILHLRCAPVQNDRLMTEDLAHFIEKDTPYQSIEKERKSDD